MFDLFCDANAIEMTHMLKIDRQIDGWMALCDILSTSSLQGKTWFYLWYLTVLCIIQNIIENDLI